MGEIGEMVNIREMILDGDRPAESLRSIKNHLQDLEYYVANFETIPFRCRVISRELAERRLKITREIDKVKHHILKNWRFKEAYGEVY